MHESVNLIISMLSERKRKRMKIEMIYNPYKLETVILYQGTNLMEKSKLSRYDGRVLQVWIKDFFNLLIDELNDDCFELSFTGTYSDFSDLLEMAEEYPGIRLVHIPVKEENKIELLYQSVNSLQDAPTKALRDKSLIEQFKAEIDREFEIAVIATMSSGKSTLINALIGHELLPSKNQACTAKITKIKNIPDKTEYDVIAYDQDMEIVKQASSIDVNTLTKFNDDEKISYVEIEGPIPSIRNQRINIALVDTPGPNNSMDSRHKLHTMEVIKSEKSLKPLILYVLNSTQLGINDDHELLNSISEHMGGKSGKGAKDRFIFALNKADEFDPEKGESIEEAVNEVKNYLKKFDISNPNIFPISAEIAKLVRKKNMGYVLTRKEKGTYASLKSLFLEEPNMQLNKYASLNTSLKSKISSEIDITEDEDDKVLHYSGITSLEEAINEYLEKYAVTSKVYSAVEVIRRLVIQQKAEAELKTQIALNRENREKITEIIDKMQNEVSKKEKIDDMIKEIRNFRENINTKESFKSINQKIFKRFSELTQQLNSSDGNIRKKEAELLVVKAIQDVEMLQIDAITDVENKIASILKTQIERSFQAYQDHIRDIVSFGHNQFDVEVWQDTFAIPELESEKMIENNTFVQKGIVRYENKNNEDRLFWQFWKPKTIQSPIQGNVEYVNMKELSEALFLPIEENIEYMFEQAFNFTDTQLKRFEIFFKEEAERFDELTKTKLNEIKAHAQKADYLVDEEDRLKNAINWVKHFLIYLDKIIEMKVKEEIKS